MRIFFIRKTIWISIFVVLLSIFLYGVIQNAGAKRPFGTRLYLVSVGNGDPDNINPARKYSK